MTQSINRQIAKGAIWMMAMRGGIKFIGIISTIILARLLTPEDFGLVALGTSIYALLELLRAFGFDTVLIQKQRAGREYYDTAWTIQVITSIVAAVVIFIISFPFAKIYDDYRLKYVLIIMATIIVVNGLNNIGTVDFRKNLNFNKEFKYQVSVKLGGFFVTITLAFLLKNYLALLFGMLSTRLLSLLLGYKMHPYRPRLSLAVWKDILGFSTWLLINNLLFYLNNQGQNLILGKIIGSAQLGIFSISNEIGLMTATDLTASINRAAYPGFAKVSNDKSQLKETFIKVYSNIALIATPSALGISAMAPVLVPLFLGDQWLATIPLIQTISIASLLISLNSIFGYVYLALSLQKITTFFASIRLMIFIPILILLTNEYGTRGAGYAILIISGIMSPILIITITRILNIRVTVLLASIYRPVLSSVVMYAFVSYLIAYQETNHTSPLYLVVLMGIFTGVLIYPIALLALWYAAGKPTNSAEHYIIKSITKRYFEYRNKFHH